MTRINPKKGQVLKRRRFVPLLSCVLCVSLVASMAVNAFAQDESTLTSVPEESTETANVSAAGSAQTEEKTQQKPNIVPYADTFYRVTFLDHDDTELVSYEVEAGQTAPVPAPPFRQDYVFVGWDTELTNIQGDLTAKAQYRELRKYTITIQYQFADGRVAAQPYIAEVKEGYSLSEAVISPAVTGYRPDQNTILLQTNSADQNRSYTVVYTKESGTGYKVIHHLETLTPGEYEVGETDSLFGETTQNVVATPKNYSGFELVLPLASGTIAADGSLELNVYYKRKTVILSFETEGGTYVEPLMGRYGEALTPPVDPERPGHTFAAWDPEIPVTFPAEDITFIARWTVDTEADYIMLYWVENANDDGYSMVGLEIKNGTVGVAAELPDPANPFPDNIPFPNTSSRDKKEYFYEYNQTKTEETNSDVLIDAEKSVFVNVYFDRKEFTVHFVYRGHPIWFHPDNVLDPGVFTPLARKYQIEMGGNTRISEDYGTTYDFTNGQDTLISEVERTVSVTAKYMANISADVPRIRYLGVAGIDPEQPAIIANFYSENRRTWPYHMTTSDPITHQSPVMTAYYFVNSYGYYRGTECTVFFSLANTVHTPSYQYAPMFEPIGGGKEDHGDYIAGEPITVTFFDYSSDTSIMTRSFVGFRAPTPDRFYNPWYGGIENAEYQWPDDAKAYYERERYTLGFYDGTTALKEYADDEAIWYEEELADYYYEPATPADKPGYTFAGWYTDQILQDETTLLDFDRAIMPAQGLMLYAKWTPPTYQITFDLNGGTGSDPADQNIRLGGYINPPAEPTREGYTFGGWTERNRTVIYNMSYPVNRHLDLVARWTPNVSGTYTVYYLELGTNRSLVDSKTLHNLVVASSHTETAELIDGYLPDAVSKSISLNASARYNSIVFYYKAFSEVDYTLRYETTDGRTLRSDETKTTTYNYVTENFTSVPGYRVLEEQITTPLSFNEANNVMVFKYLPNDSVLYTVRHYTQNLDGRTYFLTSTDLLFGRVNTEATANPRSYVGFTYNAAASIATGRVTGDGKLVLELYYNRQTFTVSFVAGTGGNLYGVSVYEGILWGTPFGQAVSIPVPQSQTGYTFARWTPALAQNNQTVTQDVVYTALFKQNSAVVIPVVDDPDTEPMPPTSDPEPTAPTPTPESDPVVPDPDPAEDPDTETIQTDSIPLFGTEGYWALLNLILAIVGILAGLIVTIKRFMVRRKDKEEPEQESSRRDTNLGRRKILSVFSLAIGIVSLIAFFLTEDMTLLMAIMDQWTMLMLALAVIEALLIVLSFYRKTHRNSAAPAY